MTKLYPESEDRPERPSNVETLARCRELRKTMYVPLEDSDEERSAQNYMEALNVRLCTTRAKTPEDLAAQIA